MKGEYIDREANAGRMLFVPVAIVAEARRGRIYISVDKTQVVPAENAAQFLKDNISHEKLPSQECRGTFASNAQGRRYGFKTFSDYFTPRQLVALATFSSLVTEARGKASEDAKTAGLDADGSPLHLGGGGAIAYADAIATYLAFAVDNVSDRNATLVSWASNREHTRNVFARQALTMTWDFCETNVLSGSSGNFFGGVEKIEKLLRELHLTGFARVEQQAAQNQRLHKDAVISTDPPYYDNITYADLSDYFYVWMRPMLSNIWPDLFRRLVTPKEEELVATPYRPRDPDNHTPNQIAKMSEKEKAEAFFMEGMKKALVAMVHIARDNDPLTIYYAFKQAEAAEDGITSAGWASFLQAIHDAGLGIDGTWPIRTELERRFVGKDANALASAIVLVCRKRAPNAPVVTRADFIRTLKGELPDAISDIRMAGVGPVDMQQSVIGPGMGIFTRFTKVLEDDDSAMSVKTALALINRVWQEIESELDARFDAETQVALAWFSTYGLDQKASGELITLANAKDIALNALTAAGVFEAKAGKARLLGHADLDPAEPPTTGMSVWEGVQRTAAVVRAAVGGAQAAARVVQALGSRAADARALAYRLYEICAQKGWNQQALVYNELAQEWLRLEDLAQRRVEGAVGADQPTLF